jgi:hypothetical protein
LPWGISVCSIVLRFGEDQDLPGPKQTTPKRQPDCEIEERNIMPDEAIDLALTIQAMRPMVPAKDFELSARFYIGLGFRRLTLIEDKLAEMRLGECAFLLQNYYVKEWADNFVIYLRVSNLSAWWTHIASLDLPSRYGSKLRPPQQEGWALVAGVTDPSGVLWRIAEHSASNATISAAAADPRTPNLPV